MRPARHRASRGFALIYALVVLGVLAGLMLAEARELRRGLRVAQALTEQAQARDRLRAAATLLVGRWQAQAALQRLGADANETMRTLVGELIIDGELFAVRWEDADLRPDANSLGEAEWQRLFAAYGFSPEQGELFLRRLAEEKQQAGGRLDNLDRLVDDAQWPATVGEGRRDSPYGVLPPLKALLASDGGPKRLHARDSPPVLFAVLLGAQPDQLAALANLRRLDVVQCKDLELSFGPALRNLCYDGPPQRLRVRLTPELAPLAAELTLGIQAGRIIATPVHIVFAPR